MKTSSDTYYLQDSRSYVGNDLLFWSISDGYTTNVARAKVFTLEEAQRQHNTRHTDIPWPKAYIDEKVRPTVDMQYVSRANALASSAISLNTPGPTPKDSTKCHHCGAFMNEGQRYMCGCEHCNETLQTNESKVE